jgi:mannose-6-phosphate isomerase-like protein (cupin superfamily)
MSTPIRIIGQSIKVVDHDGLTITECIGNAATHVDDMSVALVNVEGPTSEPWLTIHYDEYMHVTEGCLELHYYDSENKLTQLNVTAGQTAFIAKGSRFQPRFPAGVTKYIPVCLPAFKPERCIREEGTEASDVSKKLNELHSKPSADEVNDKYKHVNKIYHMCQKKAWEECKAQSRAYYPPTLLLMGK